MEGSVLFEKCPLKDWFKERVQFHYQDKHDWKNEKQQQQFGMCEWTDILGRFSRKLLQLWSLEKQIPGWIERKPPL